MEAMCTPSNSVARMPRNKPDSCMLPNLSHLSHLSHPCASAVNQLQNRNDPRAYFYDDEMDEGEARVAAEEALQDFEELSRLYAARQRVQRFEEEISQPLANWQEDFQGFIRAIYGIIDEKQEQVRLNQAYAIFESQILRDLIEAYVALSNEEDAFGTIESIMAVVREAVPELPSAERFQGFLANLDRQQRGPYAGGSYHEFPEDDTDSEEEDEEPYYDEYGMGNSGFGLKCV